MKFSAVIVFALGVAAAVIPETNAPVEDFEIEARADAAEAACGVRCPAPVRIQSQSCNLACQSGPCSLYACEAGRRAVCPTRTSGNSNCRFV